MTETQTQQTAIQDLKRQVREADNHQHSLARELDGMDSLIEEAVKRDVRRRAKAARSGEPLSAADEISEVSALRQRQKDLPLLIWAAKVDHAGREIEMYAREQERAGRDAELESNGLAALKVEADEANRKLREKSNRVFRLTNAESSNSLSRARAEKRLTALEQEHPDA